jgi:hypothetical protein
MDMIPKAIFDQLVFIFAKERREKKSYPAMIANIPQYEFVIFTVQAQIQPRVPVVTSY